MRHCDPGFAQNLKHLLEGFAQQIHQQRRKIIAFTNKDVKQNAPTLKTTQDKFESIKSSIENNANLRALLIDHLQSNYNKIHNEKRRKIKNSVQRIREIAIKSYVAGITRSQWYIFTNGVM